MKSLFRIWLVAGFAAAALATTEPGDDVLARARALAENSMRPEAIAMLRDHLREHPADADARVLYGLVLSWEGRYREAREQLRRVLAEHPDYDDARRALVNVELWSEHPEQAEKLAAVGLEKRPDDPEYLYNRARALKALHKEKEAIAVVNRLLEVRPDHPHAASLRRELEDQAQPWVASFSQSHEWFSDAKIGGWDESQLSLSRRTPVGAVVARFSHATHFGIPGNQAEIEWYPHFRRGTYAYLGAGYSYDATLYPHYRINAELYHNFPYRLEGSAGIRYMAFSNRIVVYTASLGRYQGKWLFTGRTYLTGDLNGLSHSIQISARRYLNDHGDFFGFRFGHGSSLFETVRTTDLNLLSSTSFAGEWSSTVARRWNFTLRGGISQEERMGLSPLLHYLADSSLFYRF